MPAPTLGDEEARGAGAGPAEREAGRAARSRACRVLAALWANSEGPPWLQVWAAPDLLFIRLHYAAPLNYAK